MEDILLDARLEIMNDLTTIRAIERGGNGWKEATINQGLVLCTSPIRGNAYSVICRGGEFKKYLGFAVTIRVLASGLGRVFVDDGGRMMLVTDLSQEEVEQLAELIAEDIADMAGLTD